MKFKSLLEIFSDIKNIVNVNPISTNIGVITNEFAGEDFLINKIVNYYESKSKTKVIIVEGNTIRSIELLELKLCSTIIEDFEKNISSKLINHSYTDLFLSYLNLLPEFNIYNLVFIVRYVEQLDINTQYNILSQFRNVREKLKVKKSSAYCHFLILGRFSYFDLSNLCQKYGTSFILDDIFYFSASNRSEQNLILQDESIVKLNEQILGDVIQDISSGVIGLLILLNNMDLPQNINKLLEQLSNDSKINSIIKTTLEKQNSNTITLIKNIIEKKQNLYNFNPELEKLYLSGLVSIKSFKDNYVVSIDSWLLETHARKLLSSDKKDYLSYHQLLPLYISLNLIAYRMIMEIENYLRNNLLSHLSCWGYKIHPLEILDCFGKIKPNNSEKRYTYYEWCKHKLHQNKKLFKVDLFESLSAQLDLTDLEEIYLSEPFPKEFSEIRFKIRSNLSLKVEELKDLFNKLRRIRNPIAHNQIINFSVINELEKIKKNLFYKK